MTQPLPPGFLRHPLHLLAFGFGSGAVKRAPGTVGTLAAVPLFWLMSGVGPFGYALVVTLMFIAGVWLCHITARDLGVHDHPGIVWDEFVGLLLTLSAAPPGAVGLVFGFLWFRLFDIWKPWPIRWFDRHVEGGLGIMLDDVIAALFAIAALRLTVWFLGY